MTTKGIQRLHATQPFEPFRILVADGRHCDVRHPENLAIAGNGRLIAIGLPDHSVTLDPLLASGAVRPIPRRGNATCKKPA